MYVHTMDRTWGESRVVDKKSVRGITVAGVGVETEEDEEVVP